MDVENIIDKCRGSLVGGAVGDALGYPVEFVGSYQQICARYGERGIEDYDIYYPWHGGISGKALFSDDTQMTLYTAEGLLHAQESGKPMLTAICDAYLAWYGPQVGRKAHVSYDSKLAKIEELNQNRAPGGTCLSSLGCIYSGHEPQNSSKGCGGVMRVAPIGIYGAAHGWTAEQTGMLAGQAAELTHGHIKSTFSSAVQAMVIQACILAEQTVTVQAFKAIVEDALGRLPKMYPGHDEKFESFSALIRKALAMGENHLPDWEIIENELGEGWVADEALAISIFCVARHIGDFKACMVSAVNHGGDSDSTGAIAGNILGAILGMSAIPAPFLSRLQLLPLITEMADSLVK